MKNSVMYALEKAVKGRVYISETEAELEPFLWDAGDLTTERLLESAGAEKGTAVEETTLDSFNWPFARRT